MEYMQYTKAAGLGQHAQRTFPQLRPIQAQDARRLAESHHYQEGTVDRRCLGLAAASTDVPIT